MKNKRQKSEIIADFLNLVEEARKEYKMAEEYIDKSNKATTDMLHSLEFEDARNQRNKMATELHIIRKDRRYWKDVFEEAEPLVEYFTQNQKACNCLKEVLGQTRKVESYHEVEHINQDSSKCRKQRNKGGIKMNANVKIKTTDGLTSKQRQAKKISKNSRKNSITFSKTKQNLKHITV